MIIVIASGKGGTGKTTVAVNLAKVMSEPVQLLDCDVEEPNAHLFIKGEKIGHEIVNRLVPQISEEQCNACGDCSQFCQFNAILTVGNRAQVFADLCHSCGGCALVCRKHAISEMPSPIGSITVVVSGNVTLIQGTLDVGVASATPLIDAVKGRLRTDRLAILDAPPGTSCPAVATMRRADYVVLVTEPTPFGLNDLKLAVATATELGTPFGVVVNRLGIGDDRIHRYCEEWQIPILLEIPDDRRIAECYSRGDLLVETHSAYRNLFHSLRDRLLNQTFSPEALAGQT